MQEHQNLSDLEKATLDRTVVDICHLFIGDQIRHTDDKEKTLEILAQRDKLWLDTTIQAGVFENRAYWIHKELSASYAFFNYGFNRYHAPDARQIQHELFHTPTRDKHVPMLLTYLTVAYTERNHSKDYAGKAREILKFLRIEYGLIDDKLERISLYELIELILTIPSVWDDGETAKQ